jgi:hypothetical protein
VCQNNDELFSALLYQYSQNILADIILFGDSTIILLYQDHVLFRRQQETNLIFEYNREPVGKYVLLWRNEIIASGGFALHYKILFADLYLEVKEIYQIKGFESFFVQELYLRKFHFVSIFFKNDN